MENTELAIKLKNIVFENEQRHSDVIDYDELIKEFKQALNISVVVNCTEIEQPYFDKNGKTIKEFAVLKVYHFLGVNDKGRGRKHHYMYKWVRLKEIQGKMCYVALHLTKGDNSSYNLRVVADKQTRIIADSEIVQTY